jgi:hypothetical protein
MVRPLALPPLQDPFDLRDTIQFGGFDGNQDD